MKKKRFAALALGAFLLAGCQITPERQTIVSKNNGFFEEAIGMTHAAGKVTPSRLQLDENFTSTDGNVHFHMEIDQTIVSEKMPVVEVVPRTITSEDIERVARALLGDVEFYEREPSSNPQYSKSQYQEMMTRLVPYSNLEAMTDLVGMGQARETLDQLKVTIDSITRAMETAPEEDPHVPCDWTLKKERVYNDNEWEITGRSPEKDSDWLVATAEKRRHRV